MMKKRRLRGKKVYLEPARKEDIAVLKRFALHPQVRKWWYGKSERVTISFLKNEWRGYFGGKVDRKDGRAFRIMAEGDIIGFINHNEIEESNKTSIDIMIGSTKHLGKGYGTDAIRRFLKYLFSTLKLRRVYIKPVAKNARAIAAYQKAGFRFEGILRQAELFEGRYVDIALMAVLKDEFSY
jgi:ribosomal-protein-alanine N-acetyltransferase